MTYNLIVFDLDGTLVDSIADLALAVNRLVSEYGGRELAEDAVSRMVGEGAGILVSRAVAASGALVDPADALPRFLSIYDSLLPGQTRPYEGIPEVLEAAARSRALAVLTNKPIAATRRILDAHDLSRRFLAIAGGDGPYPRKPDPAGLLDLATLAGTDAAHTLLVGDSMVDLSTAKRAGAGLCVARYGFGQATFDPSALDGTEHVIDRPLQLLDLLHESR